MEETTERVLEAAALKDYLLLHLNDSKVSKERFKHRLLQQDVILKPTTVSEKKLKNKLSSPDNEKTMPEKTTIVLIKRDGEQNAVKERDVQKLVKVFLFVLFRC